MISKELLSEVFTYSQQDFEITGIKEGSKNTLQYFWIQELQDFTGDGFRRVKKEINIHELANECLVYAWDKMYEITPRVMGAEIMCLKTGYEEHIIQREDIDNPEKFDPRFVIEACQWIFENKELK